MDVKSYIEKNHHLKDIPSAKEIESQGLTLGEMNRLMMIKIEELTLYTIQQEEKIEQLEQENKALKSLEERLSLLEVKLRK